MGNEDAHAADGELEADPLHALDYAVQHLPVQRSEHQGLEGNGEDGFAVFVDHAVLDLLDLEDGDEVAVLYRAGPQEGVEPCELTCC